MIDRGTIQNLEILKNNRTGSQRESLFGSINHTCTVIGARMLRLNLLLPPNGVFDGLLCPS